MADTNTGGAAFPNQRLRTNGDDGCGMYAFDQGMTLRDYFAAKAIPTAWDAYDKGYFSCESDDANKNIARCAYKLADAMLEARKA